MTTLLVVIGLIVLLAVCIWLGVLGLFFRIVFAILGALGGSSKSSGSNDKFGGGSFGGGGSSDNY